MGIEERNKWYRGKDDSYSYPIQQFLAILPALPDDQKSHQRYSCLASLRKQTVLNDRDTILRSDSQV